MDRYQTRIEGGTLSIEVEDGWLEVGEMDAIHDLVGGETYTIEYTEEEAAMPWLDTDDGAVTVDVRETLADASYDDELVQNLASVPLSETGSNGYPLRTEVFVDLVTHIWDSKGAVSASDDPSR